MEEKKVIHSNEYHLLRRSNIQKEMKQMMENLYITAGSVGGLDLYKVIQTYILDLEKWHTINELLHVLGDASFYYEK